MNHIVVLHSCSRVIISYLEIEMKAHISTRFPVFSILGGHHYWWSNLLRKNHCTAFFHIGQHSQGGGFFAQVLSSRCLSNDTQRGWCFWICFDLPPKLITSFVGENTLGLEDILYPLINFISCVNHHGLHFVERSSEVITLGSRQSLCINESLRSRARGAGHLNDLCRRGIPARWKHRKTQYERPPKPPTFWNSYTRTLILDIIMKLSGTIGVTQKTMTFDTHVCLILL